MAGGFDTDVIWFQTFIHDFKELSVAEKKRWPLYCAYITLYILCIIEAGFQCVTFPRSASCSQSLLLYPWCDPSTTLRCHWRPTAPVCILGAPCSAACCSVFSSLYSLYAAVWRHICLVNVPHRHTNVVIRYLAGNLPSLWCLHRHSVSHFISFCILELLYWNVLPYLLRTTYLCSLSFLMTFLPARLSFKVPPKKSSQHAVIFVASKDSMREFCTFVFWVCDSGLQPCDAQLCAPTARVIVLCRLVGQVKRVCVWERQRLLWGNPWFCTNTTRSEPWPELQQTNSWVLFITAMARTCYTAFPLRAADKCTNHTLIHFYYVLSEHLLLMFPLYRKWTLMCYVFVNLGRTVKIQVTAH